MHQRSVLPIFLTVFIDMLGVGIIIPVIPPLIISNMTGLVPTYFDDMHRSVLYGCLVAAYPFMQFFGAPMLGALSDNYGRKPLLQLSLLGTMLGYLLFALAILQKNLPLLFFSRMLPGFMGGNISILQSSISDVSSEEDRTRNFGMIGTAFGIGFILGPAIGGILADPTVVPWFNSATPFWFTAILTGFNLLLVQFFFTETIRQRQKRRVNPFLGLQNLAASFHYPHLRVIFGVVLLMSLGFSFFTQFFSVYLIKQFSFTGKEIGLLYAWVGLWLAFTQGFLVRRLSYYYSPYQILPYSIPLFGLALGSLLLPDQAWMFYLFNPIVAIFHGITSPNTTSVVSKQANPQEQGRILGINQSMLAVGQVLPPLIAGFINAIDVRLPLVAASVLILLAWRLYMFAFETNEIK